MVQRHGCSTLTLGLAAGLLVQVAQAAPLGIGPLRLGMTLDEVKAAMPTAAWRDTMVSRFSGRVFGAYSDDPVEIAGLCDARGSSRDGASRPERADARKSGTAVIGSADWCGEDDRSATCCSR